MKAKESFRNFLEKIDNFFPLQAQIGVQAGTNFLRLLYKGLQRGFHSFKLPWTRSPSPSARIPSNFLLRRGMILVLNAVTTVYGGFEHAEIAHKKYTKTCTYGRFFGNALIYNIVMMIIVPPW